MTKEQVKKILLENNISIKKHYGQNFLLDNAIIEKIVSNSSIPNNIGVVEIGPGLGFLTNHLSKVVDKVLCYEIDKEMVAHLKKQNYPNVEIIHDDVLKRNIDSDCLKYFGEKEVYIIANLPYYITTPILLKVLEESKIVTKMVVMMQTEVAKRICGKPSTKEYNCLSVLIQYFTYPKILFHVKPHSFYPEPLVDSSVVELNYKDEIIDKAIDGEYFLKFNRAIFSQRRKTLFNNIIKAYAYNKDEIMRILKMHQIEKDTRSEALTVKQIVDLSNDFYQTFVKTNNQNT